MTLPGLPTPEPTPPVLTPLDEACDNLQRAVIEVIMMSRTETPGVNPADAAAQTIIVVTNALAQLISAPALRAGVLSAL